MIRKCAACPVPIEIDRNHTSNVVFYKKKYYHSNCFCDLAAKRSQAKIKSASEWKEALDNLWELEAETEKMLKNSIAKDELNEWLLSHYDIAVVPARLWQIVADLERGVYKGKRCKPVSMEMLVGVWKWGQRKLDEIAANNRANHNGPSNGDDRIRYDLAILLSHTNDYIKYTQRNKEEAADIAAKVQSAKRFDYEKIYEQAQKKTVTDNILDLMNDIF